MAYTLTYEGSLTVTECWCGMKVGVPSNLFRQAYDHGRSIYCPSGHTFSWNETEADRQKNRADRAEREAREERLRRQAERDLREHTERQLAAQKGATTKARKRAAAALCPCCNRSFVQLRRHMAAKHPDYMGVQHPAEPEHA